MTKKFEIDSSNTDELKRFFEEHYDYTTPELSFKYGIPPSTLRYWKRKAKIESTKPKAFTAVRKKSKVETVNDSNVWDNAEWFQEHYVNKRIGAYIISRMINRSVVVVYRRLERYGIKRRSHREATKPTSEYYNREWLIENYFKHKRSLGSIAAEVGVTPYTISNWMVSLKLLPRDRNSQSVASYNRKRWNKRTED